MACYHPLKAWAKINPLNPLKKVIRFNLPDKDLFSYEEIKIPCGQCIGCRLEYSRQWAIRCVLEAKQWKHNCFLTLTYNDEFLPIQENVRVDKCTGEVERDWYSHSLVPEHLTKFMKDLRAYFSYHYGVDNIRFFACGEYGSLNMRPHFHILLFNCHIPDLKLFKSNYRGDCVYTSDIISKLWNKGFITIGELNFETAAYTARYIMKKQKGNSKDYYSDLGLVPEFTRMSRNPGIANKYYDEEHGTFYDIDKIPVACAQRIVKNVKPPAYYDRLYEVENPEHMKEIKENRLRLAKINLENTLKNTDLNEDEYLLVQEQNKLLSISALKRNV